MEMTFVSGVNGLGSMMECRWVFTANGATVTITEDQRRPGQRQFQSAISQFTEIVPETTIGWPVIGKLSSTPDVAAREIVTLHHEGKI